MIAKNPGSARAKKTDDDAYAVEFVKIDDIKPSPENDDIYGAVVDDQQMELLVGSIRNRGLEEPIIVSADYFIVSGHRRFFAMKQIGGDRLIPIRRKRFRRADHLYDWPQILAEYNPQRIKSVGSLLKESLLRHADDNPSALLKKHTAVTLRGSADFLEVDGTKTVHTISEKKLPFLKAVQKVVTDLEEFWPLTIRQIHYNLLNNPPLITTPKRSKFDVEHYRYRNNQTSYDALISLLKAARYEGHVSIDCIDDPTRPTFLWRGWSNVSEFVEQEMNGFLCGYHYNRQLDQPRHIEVLAEKNTLIQILKPICSEYYVPLSIGRGFACLPLIRDIAGRFKDSGKDAMTLIVCSDMDPEGLELADDAIRSLRDLWNIPVNYHRAAVTQEHVDELGLAEDSNPAKEKSSNFDRFIEKTGSNKTWELESLPPKYLRELVRNAIVENLDVDMYDVSLEQERNDAGELQRIRAEIVESFDL